LALNVARRACVVLCCCFLSWRKSRFATGKLYRVSPAAPREIGNDNNRLMKPERLVLRAERESSARPGALAAAIKSERWPLGGSVCAISGAPTGESEPPAAFCPSGRAASRDPLAASGQCRRVASRRPPLPPALRRRFSLSLACRAALPTSPSRLAADAAVGATINRLPAGKGLPERTR
jgi:hypothetical protein